VWNRLGDELIECRTRLQRELCAIRDDLISLVSHQLAHLSTLANPSGSLDELAAVYHGQAPLLLFTAYESFQKLRPQQRALAALDDYDRSIDQLIFAMPETLGWAEPGWADLTARLSRARRALLRLHRRQDGVVRSAIVYGARRHRIARRRIDGRLLCALGHLSLELLTPWDALRRACLAQQPSPAAGRAVARG
jgi:hypothetical protein